jgi:hypothetical protein
MENDGEGRPFMVVVEVNCRVGRSAKNRKRGADCLNGVHPFPDAGLPSDCLLCNLSNACLKPYYV